MREAVFARDREMVADAVAQMGYTTRWERDRLVMPLRVPTSIFGVVCPAFVIDPDQFGLCWGRWTIDHVKSTFRLGLRAPSDLGHLMALCEGHTENGMKAGSQWNTGNRPEQRDYLKQANKEA